MTTALAISEDHADAFARGVQFLEFSRARRALAADCGARYAPVKALTFSKRQARMQ
jgi:hypothetical protein